MAFSPINMTNVDLTIGDEATPANFKCQIRSVELAPETNIIRTMERSISSRRASRNEIGSGLPRHRLSHR